MFSFEESKSKLMSGLKQYTQDLGEEAVIDAFLSVMRGWKLIERLYTPDNALVERLEQFSEWCKTKTGEDPGRLMEEISVLALRCLSGFEVVKSYQSYAGQIDLLLSGSSPEWLLLMKYLHLDIKHRGIVVEAKNLNEKVDDKQFSRFCYHLQNTFTNTAQLGIFFTRLGATGFPQRSSKTGTRQRVLRDAQATQILFHARNNKYVVVLDEEEILQLGQPGSLLYILEEKIRQVEQWTGLLEFKDPNLPEIDLPNHLARHFRT